MRRRAEAGVITLAAIFFLLFAVLSFNYYRLAVEKQYVETAAERSFITIHAGDSQGTIYDRNLRPLTNAGERYVAVVVPSAADLAALEPHAADIEQLRSQFEAGEPFAAEFASPPEESEAVTVFTLPERYSAGQPAQHVVGYLSEDRGVSGLEYAYDSLLRNGSVENSVTYSTDGFGHILIGDGKSVVRSEKQKTGVVTTIDADVQRICEEAGRVIDKGAIVVSDVKSGDILGLASFPAYSWDDIGSALTDERSPMIDRALYAYSVGSIFKLVTACQALNTGDSGYVYDCVGNVDVSGQNFACHKPDGHGQQDMTQAMTNSCNPYFISLSRSFDIGQFRSLAFSLGFGREIHLCAGMTASAGVLPTVKELLVPAELANFSFGQGKLTATPLQINQLTAAIANGGELTMLRLIRGVTVDGETVGNEKSALRSRVIDSETAKQLRRMMTAAVYRSDSSNAKPRYVRVGAKTSTAQTGRFDDDGEELCNAWITGFFPSNTPRYSVTVLVEDGGYGNEAAAPIFRELADRIMALG